MYAFMSSTGPVTTSIDCPFVINGRFLTQKTTGVQRYAREIASAIDVILDGSESRGEVMVPTSPMASPVYSALDIVRAGPGSGYVWEQLTLPLQSRKPILNLCNTASIMRSDQIICIHDANIFKMPDSFSFAFRNAYRVLHPMLARRGLKITTVSNFAADELAEFLPVRRQDVSVMPNGHEHAFRWRPESSDIFDRFPVRRPFILLLGNRAKHKNASLILNLAGDLDRMGLDLIVAGSSAGIFTETHSISASNIRTVGFVSDDDLAALFSKAMCLAFPSITEGFGLPVVEAMALGCPVVSSNASCLPEICGEAALLASPHDPAAWLAHFGALSASQDLRSELSARGRLQVKLFSWETSARNYLELL
jgi:glycosyltransferase involved in cell wall biosynthesis